MTRLDKQQLSGPYGAVEQQVIESEQFMQEALDLAHLAAKEGEVPVGAVVVLNGEIVGRGRNSKEAESNPMGHAEIQALSEASKNLGRWRLSDCEMYVTLEPCPMCAGALLSARLGKLVIGCRDPKGGATHSLYNLLSDSRLNHQVEMVEGVLESSCSLSLKNFFRELRKVQGS